MTLHELAHLRSTATRNGITVAALCVLGAVKLFPMATMQQIAEILGMTSAGITNSMDSLEKRGLAERRRSEYDRRVLFVHATKKGAETVDKVLGDVSYYSDLRKKINTGKEGV